MIFLANQRIGQDDLWIYDQLFWWGESNETIMVRRTVYCINIFLSRVHAILDGKLQSFLMKNYLFL